MPNQNFSAFFCNFRSNIFDLNEKKPQQVIPSQKVYQKISQLNQKLFKNFDLGKIAAAFKIQEITLFFTKYGRIAKLDDPILTTNTIF